MRTALDVCADIFQDMAQDEMTSPPSEPPEWLKTIREEVYIDRQGRLAYRTCRAGDSHGGDFRANSRT